MRKKKKKASLPVIMLVAGIAIFSIVAALQDNLPSLLNKIKHVDYILIEEDKNTYVRITDSIYFKKMFSCLREAKKVDIYTNKPDILGNRIQVYFYRDKCSINLTLLKSSIYGYLIKVNNHFYKSEEFNMMILNCSAFEKRKL